MTHPDYRNRGLSAKLMNKVLQEYENRYDLMYLFANQSVLDFYPKFGFERVEEVQFSMDYSWTKPTAGGIRKLDGRDPYHLNFIYRLATERVPVSNRFSTQNAQGILMFYCIYIFPDDLYYLEEEDAVIIYTKEGKQIDLYDVISKNEIDIEAILSRISSKDTSKIVFHYTPDNKNITTKSQVVNGDHVLFVRANGNHKYPFHVKHPVTSQA
ncbi:GNAT family N-acetyltransferase [Jeotgalibacillus proteolyticus]|uniref:GNAT family N-acetyltransferase n=1 Tax=Jeotgalibacillus proteolyticus TaxID=2082395 RepID=A0A2S5GAB4_9BACL|nr:GNAT family N-acetyltransferase [Jeotgalibacillus proteolyticus]PPA69938.1 GNAT family N-acetyltransferase [Jeotgalibacillus proteolyticus]